MPLSLPDALGLVKAMVRACQASRNGLLHSIQDFEHATRMKSARFSISASSCWACTYRDSK